MYGDGIRDENIAFKIEQPSFSSRCFQEVTVGGVDCDHCSGLPLAKGLYEFALQGP
jgi:hypothetical protein